MSSTHRRSASDHRCTIHRCAIDGHSSCIWTSIRGRWANSTGPTDTIADQEPAERPGCCHWYHASRIRFPALIDSQPPWCVSHVVTPTTHQMIRALRAPPSKKTHPPCPLPRCITTHPSNPIIYKPRTEARPDTQRKGPFSEQGRPIHEEGFPGRYWHNGRRKTSPTP